MQIPNRSRSRHEQRTDEDTDAAGVSLRVLEQGFELILNCPAILRMPISSRELSSTGGDMQHGLRRAIVNRWRRLRLIWATSSFTLWIKFVPYGLYVDHIWLTGLCSRSCSTSTRLPGI